MSSIWVQGGASLSSQSRWMLVLAFSGTTVGVAILGCIVASVIWVFGADARSQAAPQPTVGSAPTLDASQTQRDPAANAPPAVAASPSAPAPTSPSAAASPPPSTARDSSASAVVASPATQRIALQAADFPNAELPIPPFGDPSNWNEYSANRPKYARAWAYLSAEQHLAAFGPFGEAVGFVSVEAVKQGGMLDPKVVELTGIPQAMAYKQLPDGKHAVIVSQIEPEAIVVIDAQSLTIRDTIDVSGSVPMGILPIPDPTSSDVLFFRRAVGERDMTVSRLDLSTREIEHFAMRLGEGTVTPDGKYVFRGSDRLTVPPKGADPDHPWTELRAFAIGFPRGHSILGPRGRAFAVQNALYSTDLQTKLMEFSWRPVQFFKEQPWVVGVLAKELVIGSLNDGNTVATISLPNEWLGPDANLLRDVERITSWNVEKLIASTRIYLDEAAGNIVIASLNRVAVLPIDELKLPDHPNLATRDPLPTDAQVGKPLEHALTTISGSPTPTLVSGPEGMTIQDGTMKWTPQHDQIGPFDIQIRFEDGEITHTESWKLRVWQDHFNVPFQSRGVAFNSDGTQAVVWGHDWIDPIELAKQRQGKEAKRLATRLAIVDLNTRKVVVETTTDLEVHQAVFNATGIYAATGAGFTDEQITIARLSATDLSEVKRIEAQDGRISTIAEQMLLTQLRQSRGGPLFQLPDLDPVEPLVRPSRNEEWPAAGQVLGGWLMDGTIWDAKLRRPKLLVQPTGFVDPRSLRFASHFRSNASITAVPILAGQLLFAANGQPLPPHDMRLEALRYSPHFPAAAKLENSREGSHVDFLKLSDGSRLHRVAVVKLGMLTSHGTPTRKFAGPAVAISKSHIAITHDGLPYVFAHRGDTFPEHFYLEPEQSTLQLTVNRPTPVVYSAKNAIKYEIEIPSLLVDGKPFRSESTDGRFQIDLSPAMTTWVEQLQRTSPEAAESGRLYFRRYTGKACRGVAKLVPVHVRATSRDLETAVMQHAYLVDVPVTVAKPSGPPRPRTASAGGAAARQPTRRPDRTRPQRTTEAPKPRSTIVEYSVAKRQRTNRAEATPLPDAKAQAGQVDGAYMSRLLGSGSREWTDTTGRQMQATLVDVVGPMATLITSGNERVVQVPISRFSEADQQYIQASIESLSIGSGKRVATDLSEIARALYLHHSAHASFPPASLVSDDGQPLLSWRVLLLKELGYPQLASQFHYDEPWDSVHNRQLIPLMPAVFRGDREPSTAGHTPYVAILGENSFLSAEAANRVADVQDPRDKSLVLVEVERGPVWTRPADLPASFVPRLDQLLSSRGGRQYVLMANRKVLQLDTGTPQAEWEKLINVSDGARLEAELLAP